MAQVRTRKDVWKLAEWDPILLWYAKAVAEMKTLPINDPVGWRYQSAIHEYRRNRDPYADPGDVLPSTADQGRFWNQCQHGSWFFLPWHRMYLGFFEQIVMSVVKRLGGPDDWALPYWNYSDDSNPDARKLPPAFRAQTLPDGSTNHLRVNARVPGLNDGDEAGDGADVDLSDCLPEPTFISQGPGGAAGFGGPRTVFMHGGGTAGELERTPHGSMHMAVGFGGWMGGFSTAALDPIFWLHHCNIDRLWEVWLRRNAQHVNPNESQWLAFSFDFHNATGAIASMTPSQVTDTTAAPLLYQYEDVSDPLGGEPEMEAARFEAIEEGLMPEMIGATDQPITLRGESVTAAVPVNAPSGPAEAAREAGEAPKRVYLNIENITGEDQAESYSVYLNLPPGGSPAEHRELYAGLLPMFGVAEATDASGEHAAGGLQYTLDITELVQRLEARGEWNPSEMRVTFVPKRRGNQPEAVQVSGPVQVGRVSLYFS